MRSISGIVSIVGILLAASSSAVSVSYVNINFGGQKIFCHRGYIMLQGAVNNGNRLEKKTIYDFSV